MGKRGRGQKRKEGGGRTDEWKEDKRPRPDDPGWVDSATHENPAFEAYYKEQRICPEEEWETFIGTLRRPLPTTFRINGGGGCAEHLRDRLQSDFLSRFGGETIDLGDSVVEAPKPLSWYPDNLAWQFDISRTQLRKLPALEALHEFIKREHEAGSLTRQEAVSMVPPLLLAASPGHRVLDMCAAPGSKTLQLLEALHAGGGEPAGVVVANDADSKRCGLLTHQTQRISSPALLVTNHEAQNFPVLRNLDPETKGSEPTVLYDRVLCDVPCSGDGTLRKAPDMWRRWSPVAGNGLHGLQLRIALRGAELLRVGGRMVYSTCSFNPVENEAVVAELLRRAGGALELRDASAALPGLRRTPGLSSWRVSDGRLEGGTYGTHEEAQAAGAPRLTASMFPGGDAACLPLGRCMRFLPHHQNTGGFFVALLEKVAPMGEPSGQQAQPAAAAEAADAAVEAAAEAAAEAAEAAAAPADQADAPAAARRGPPTDLLAWAPQAPPPPKAAAAEGPAGEGARAKADERNKRASRWRGIDPVVPYVQEATLSSIQGFYGLPAGCHLLQALVARSLEDRPKKLSYVSPAVKFLLRTDARQQLKIISAGLKLFERQNLKGGCPYRVSQEGASLLLPYMGRQVLRTTAAELQALLQDRVLGLPPAAKLPLEGAAGGEAPEAEAEAPEAEAEAPAEVAAKASEAAGAGGEQPAEAGPPGPDRPRRQLQDPSTVEQLQGIAVGCCVAILRDEEAVALGLPTLGQAAAAGSATPLVAAAWRGRGNFNALVSKQEIVLAYERLQEALSAKTAAAEQAG